MALSFTVGGAREAHLTTHSPRKWPEFWTTPLAGSVTGRDRHRSIMASWPTPAGPSSRGARRSSGYRHDSQLGGAL